MKKFMKNIWIYTVIGLVLGAAFMLTGYALGGETYVIFDRNGIYVTEDEKYDNIKESTERFTNIDVDAGSCDIEIIPSESYGFEILNITPSRSFKYSVNDGTLQIINDKKWNFDFNIGFDFDFHQPTVKIYIDKNDCLGEINIRTGSGDIYADNIKSDSIIAKVSSGHIKLENCEVASINAYAGSGNINIENCTAQSDLDAKVVSGNIYLQGNTSPGIKLNSTSGNIKLYDTGADEYNISLTSGKLTASGIESKKFGAELISGNADIDGILLGDTDIKLTSGRLKLNVRGKKEDYTVMLSSTSGTCKINGEKTDFYFKGDKPNAIVANAVSGNISVNFSE